MKSTILFLIVTLVSFVSVSGQQQRVSRFGVIEIKDDEEDRLKHKLLLNGKEIFQYEGQSIEIARVLNGSGRDYLVVGSYSGGIACPVQFNIVEVHKSGAYKVSEDFGACTEPSKVRLVNQRLIIEMPLNIPHPDLLSKKELRRRERTKEVYTWFNGKLSKRTLPR